MTSVSVKIPPGYDGPLDKESIATMLRAKAGLENPEIGPSEEHEENARRLAIRLIKPHPDTNFIFSHHPVFCGIISLGLVAGNELAGLLLSNYHVVTTLVAHLYVEAKRAGLVTTRWAEMDKMIELHTEIMFGGNLPQSAAEALIRFTKLMGISTVGMNLRSDRWNGRNTPYKQPQYESIATTSALRPYLDRETSFHEALVNLERIVQNCRENSTHESKHKRRQARRKLTPLQFLIEMKRFLPSEIEKAQFDYM